MYAIIETGGKQYRVAPGDVIRVDALPAKTGEVGSIGRVLAVSPDSGSDAGKLLTGEQIGNAKVEGTVLSQGKTRKVLVFHFKASKQYKKMRGHRQQYTELRVDHITV